MVHNMFPFLRKIYMFEGCVPLLLQHSIGLNPSVGGKPPRKHMATAKKTS